MAWETKRHGYFEANKQFIAPLPIPKADRAGRAGLSALAKGMQGHATQRIAWKADLAERLTATSRVNLPLERILPDVRPVTDIEDVVPRSVPRTDRKKWIDAQRKEDEESALAAIDGNIRLSSAADVTLADGKLAFAIDEIEVARLFVQPSEAALVEAQWRSVALDFQPTGKGDAKRLIDRLRRVALTADPAVEQQIIAIGKELELLTNLLAQEEAELHELTCFLFGLSDEERKLVEAGRS